MALAMITNIFPLAEPTEDFIADVEAARRDLQTRVVSIIIAGEAFIRRAAKFSDEVLPVVNLLQERQEVAERVSEAGLE
jgi:hypothetical protein